MLLALSTVVEGSALHAASRARRPAMRRRALA